MRLRVGLAALLVFFTGCQGLIGDGPMPAATDAGSSVTLPDGSIAIAPDAGPIPCAPEATAVPKLLRLSNHEYKSMVSDLIGAPVDEALFARWTPVAEVYGFDTMSETRVDQQALEEQLATAEALASIVLATPAITAHCPAVLPEETPSCASKALYSSRDDFSDAQDRECWTYLDSSGTPMAFDNERSLWRKLPDETAWLWRDGAHPGSTVDVVRRWKSPLSGTAALSVSFADADRGGGDGVLVSVRLAGREIFTQDLPNGGQASFEQQLDLAQNDPLEFVIHRKGGPEYDTTAFSASLAFTPTPRKVAWTWASCAEPLFTRLASRAFRRPIRADELEDYRLMFEDTRREAAEAGFAEPVDEALETVLMAVLLSPSFVFKPELVPGGVDPAEKSYALASRLALYFRGSLPDDVLWALAESGALQDEAEIRAQALRLASQDLERFATHFGGQWLAYRDLGEAELAEEMRSESREVFAAVFAENLPADRLLRPGFTVVDPELAAFYGLPGSGRVTTPDRGGLLSQAGFLSRTGNGSEFRRPIHRGLWVLTRLLCESLPRLDPATREEIGASFGTIDPSLPLPQKMELHRNSQTRCFGCHGRIDPIGLALEKYDGEGVWRDSYPDGTPIEGNLELFGTVVRDPHALAAAIATSEQYQNCVSQKLLTFALNRGVLPAEQCVATRLSGPSRSLQELAVEALMRGIELTEVSR